MSTLIVHDTPIRSGYHLQVIDSVFKAFKEKYEIVSVLPHMAEKDLKKVKADRWLAEHPRILKASRKHQKILACGSLAAATVFNSEKSHAVGRVRGRGFTSPNGKYTVCTLSPSTIVKDTDFFRDLVFDIEKLITHDAPMQQPELEIVLVEKKADLKLLKELHDASFISCDIETTGMSPFKSLIPTVPPDILSIGFCAVTSENSGYVVVVPQNHIGVEVKKFLESYKGTTVFHNLKFDVQWLHHKFEHFEFHHLADTMLMNWCLDERPFNRYKNHGLDLLQRLYFDAPPKRISMKAWLLEYFRVDIGDRSRRKWVESFCNDHAEMARTAWRQFILEKTGEEADWRGKKVGRDISVDEVYEAVVEKRMPDDMKPPPTKARKEEMWDEMLTYMGEDCFSTARLYPILREKMDEENPRFWNLHEGYLIPASLAMAKMEHTGAPVNIPYLKKLKKQIEGELSKDLKEIQKIVATHTEFKAKNEEEGFNVNSSDQVKKVLYDGEVGLGLEMPKGVGRYAYKRDENALTTNSDTLKALARIVAKENPAISDLINSILRYRVKSKILGTYIEGILQRVDDDGRVRADFNLHGTATARISGSNPNLQNIPDASHVGIDIRKAYIPSKGWINIEADESQLELRVAALFSQDEVMLDAYRNGADIHQEVAYLLWNKPKDQITKYERYLAKCMNFGVIYGRGARSIATGPEMDNLVDMSGRSWTNKEIDNYFAKFKVGYKQLFDWMDLIKADSIKKQYVENPLGHRRRFDLILDSERGHILRQIVNTPIQGFAAQIVVHALFEMSKLFDPEKQRILFTVHDSIFMECRNEKKIIQETAEITKWCMEENLPKDVIASFPVLDHAPFRQGDPLTYNIPFVADIVVGPSWAECKHEVEHLVVRDPYADIDLIAA